MRTNLIEHLPIDLETIENVLRSTAVLRWSDFERLGPIEKIQLAFQLDAAGHLDHLVIWSSARRGEWDLVCDYWMKSGEMHCAGARFARNRCPQGLEEVLTKVMQQQERFTVAAIGPSGMVIVTTPTAADRVVATQVMKTAFA